MRRWKEEEEEEEEAAAEMELAKARPLRGEEETEPVKALHYSHRYPRHCCPRRCHQH